MRQPDKWGVQRFFRCALALSVALLAACGHMAETRSPRLLEAIEFNQHGEHAFLHGDYVSAVSDFKESLRINVSLENLDGIAMNRINLARSYQALDDFAEAHRSLDSVLQEHYFHFSDALMAAAATQKSVLLLSQNQLPEADKWIVKAEGFCGKCNIQGVIFNVRSSLALRMNDATSAAHWSELALKENKEHLPLEYGNSLRLLARAKLMGNAAADALPMLEEALLVDKNLGRPDKIFQDMCAMEDVYLSLGESAKALEYRERAERVKASF